MVTVNARNESVVETIQEITKGGRHVQVSLTTAEEQGIVGLPVDAITAMELEIIGSIGSPHSDYYGLLQLISSGRLNPKTLISKEVSLSEASQVLNEMMTNFNTLGFNVITKFE